jgi:hypothetical protein
MTEGKQRLVFHSEDRGFCRVYYRGERDRVLYSLDLDGDDRAISFHQCTSEGEPAWSCMMPERERLTFVPDYVRFPEAA